MKWGKKSFPTTTVDVSFKGLGIRLQEQPPPRQLVQIEIEIPGGAPVTAHAMVVHKQEGAIGVEFFGRGVGPEWDAYVQTASRTSLGPPPAGSHPPPAPGAPPPLPPVQLPTTPARAMTPAAGVTPPVGVIQVQPAPGHRTGPRTYTGAERRRAPRIALRLELRLRTPRSIHNGYTTEVSMLSAGLLVQDAQVGIGETVILNLIQPGTSFSFRRDGLVKRLTQLEGGWSHLGVEFTPLEPMREVLFADFMNVAFASVQTKP